MKQTYELYRKDGVTYVTVEKLMDDVNDAMLKLRQIPTLEMSEFDKRQVNMKILALEGMYQLLGGLVTEQNLKELQKLYGVDNGEKQNLH